MDRNGAFYLEEEPSVGFFHHSSFKSSQSVAAAGEMVVEDGVITKMFIEDEVPGDPFKVSDADTMLKHINSNAKEPASVTVFTKPGCPFCHEAKELLKTNKLNYEEVELGDGISYSTIKAVSGKLTTPQVYIDVKHIGGLDDLKKELS